MKLLAILNRGYKRDFIDVAAMLRHGLSLVQVIEWATADISGLTIESVLRSLAWRGDAESQPDPDGIDATAWPLVKREIDVAIKEVVR